MNEPYSDSVSPNLAPQPRQQMGAAAELRWRFFVNFLRTLGERLELSSRIFLGIGFVGVASAAPVGERRGFWCCTWLGTLLWFMFLFWQLFIDGDGPRISSQPACFVFR